MSRTRDLLKEYGYRPQKRRGQNFLVREAVLRQIVDAARIRPEETVVEIGPGPGNLTRHLVRAAAQVIALELEPELCAILTAELHAKNLTLIQSDVLDFDFHQIAPPAGKLKVVANLPYHITTPLLFKFLDSPELFSELLLLVQKEVAQRICAPAGKKPYGILSVQTQLFAEPELVLQVRPEDFLPRPKVHSALVRLTMREEPRAEVKDLDLFRQVVRAAFAQRRKTLRNSLLNKNSKLPAARMSAALDQARIDPGRRAETVSIPEFAALANFLAGAGGEHA